MEDIELINCLNNYERHRVNNKFPHLIIKINNLNIESIPLITDKDHLFNI